MNMISWNVNGLRAVMKKDPTILNQLIQTHQLDIICLQETKIQNIHETQMPIPAGFRAHWCSSTTKKGYSGVAILVKDTMETVVHMDDDFAEEIAEGRIICLEFTDFYLITVYVPNSGMELKRIDYRTKEWDVKLRNYINNLSVTKPVIICGDFNIAHLPIDFYNPKKYSQNSAGLTAVERAGFQSLIDMGMTDTFRHLHTDITDKFSYWSAKTKARPQNKGMRIDYFMCSNMLKDYIVDADIFCDVMGSDHCPVFLSIRI